MNYSTHNTTSSDDASTHALCTASGVPDASCTGASRAINQGKNFSGSASDQRGFFRTFDNFSIPNATGGDGTDIGADEVQATVCPEPQGFWKNNPNLWPVNTRLRIVNLQAASYTRITGGRDIQSHRAGNVERISATAGLIMPDDSVPLVPPFRFVNRWPFIEEGARSLDEAGNVIETHELSAAIRLIVLTAPE